MSPARRRRMTFIWLLMPALALFAALRYLARVAVRHIPGERPVVDDDAVRRIIEEGRLAVREDEEPLDMAEAAREEDEFWGETWDEPDEYRA
jgi:hypothetical protein